MNSHSQKLSLDDFFQFQSGVDIITAKSRDEDTNYTNNDFGYVILTCHIELRLFRGCSRGYTVLENNSKSLMIQKNK